MPKKAARRTDGRVQVQIELPPDPQTGKRKRKYFYGATQKEVNAKRDAWLADQEAQARPKHGPETTVAEWVKTWLKVYATGEHSAQESHKYQTNLLVEAMGQRKLRDVRPVDIQAFANDCEEYSKSYVTKIRDDVESVFASAEDNGLIPATPCKRINWDYQEAGTHRAIEAWERDAITRLWDRHAAGVWAMLMLYAGLRPGEAYALKWDDVLDDCIRVRSASHFEGNNIVRLENWTKTGAKGFRDVPIVAPLRAMLDRLERKPGQLVCTTTKGQPITQSARVTNWRSFADMIRYDHLGFKPNKRGDYSGLRTDRLTAAQRASLDALPAIQPYDLRHTFCTMMYTAGVDLKTAQYLMGHRKPDMILRVYAHLQEEKKAQSVDALHAYFEPAEDGCQNGCQQSEKILAYKAN